MKSFQIFLWIIQGFFLEEYDINRANVKERSFILWYIYLSVFVLCTHVEKLILDVVPEIQLIGFCAQISSCQFASQRVHAYWPFPFVVGTYVVT